MNYKDKKRFFMGIIPLMICLSFWSYVCANGADIYETDPLYDPWRYILPESDRRYLSVLEKYAEGAKNDFATWDTVGQGLIPMIANNPWSGNEMC